MNRRDFLKFVGVGLVGAFVGEWKGEGLLLQEAKWSLPVRRLGRTGHKSSILSLGGMSFGTVSQREADELIEEALEVGVNHFDLAPTYGDCEIRIAPSLKKYRDRIFLACKTTKRTREEAHQELLNSLRRTGADFFDLYQFHALDSPEDLDRVLGPGGAMEAFIEAKEKGLIKYIGITGHRADVQVEALKRFDFDTVMIPVNHVTAAHLSKTNDYRPLVRLADEKGAGVIGIKAVAKRRWGASSHPYKTWYEPFDDEEKIVECLSFVLSQGVATMPTAGDFHVARKIIQAARDAEPMSLERQKEFIASAAHLQPLFP